LTKKLPRVILRCGGAANFEENKTANYFLA
jgi:hypothetical protein